MRASLLILVALAGLGAQEFAGNEVCQACHEDIAKAFLKSSPHRAVAENTCESCHGAGAKHAESADAKLILNPRKLAPVDSEKSCATCHRSLSNQHRRHQMACASCHSIHTQPAKAECASCHLSQKTSFARTHAHPVARGAMTCTDCHNPHRAPLGEPGCLRCHGDKRGPFTFEHAPMRTDGCTACHEPHGSTNPRMLTRPVVSQLCLECHANTTVGLSGIPPAFHDLRSPRFRNCTTCHMKIHGSHVSKVLLR